MEIVKAKDLRQITDVGEVESLCRGIVEDPRHAKQVRYLPGTNFPWQKHAAKFFVRLGQSMVYAWIRIHPPSFVDVPLCYEVPGG